MNSRYQRLSAVAALSGLLAFGDRSVVAQRPATQTIGATNGQIVGVAAGIAGAGALIGILAYVAVKHNHTITGCALFGPDGMRLTTESDQQTFTMIGNVAGIKPGERVRVSGKKYKQKSAAPDQFLVEKITKDFGPCEVASSSR